jgi:hypothetical protein
MLSAWRREDLVAALRGAAPPALADVVEGFIRPFAVIEPGEGAGRSWLGGEPLLPREIDWPRAADGSPLAFIGQFDLAAVPPQVRDDLHLPGEGLLTYFFDADEQPWGFRAADRAGWRLMHLPGGEPRAPPDDISEWSVFPRKPVGLRLAWTTPDLDFTPPPGRGFGEDLERLWSDVVFALDDAGHPHAAARWPRQHRLGGWPQPIQGDFQFKCEVAARGHDAIDAWYDTYAAMAPEAAWWRLLLQIESDESENGFGWGDAGALYVSMRERNLHERAWSQAWTVLQCY